MVDFTGGFGCEKAKGLASIVTVLYIKCLAFCAGAWRPYLTWLSDLSRSASNGSIYEPYF